MHRVLAVNGAPLARKWTLGLPNSPNLALRPNQAPQMPNRLGREVVTNYSRQWSARKRKRNHEGANGHEHRPLAARAPPAKKMLTPRGNCDPLGTPYKRRRPWSLKNSTGDLTANLTNRGHDPMPTYTRLDARSSVFFCSPCAEVL